MPKSFKIRCIFWFNNCIIIYEYFNSLFMNIKTIEQIFHWKPEDGDYLEKNDLDFHKINFLRILYKFRLLNIYKKLLQTYFKYFS